MNTELEITINGKKYKVKQSFRALLYFEEMTGKSHERIEENMTDVMTLFYCILKGANKEFSFSFYDFVDVIDANPSVFEDFTNYLTGLAKSTTKGPETKKKTKGSR